MNRKIGLLSIALAVYPACLNAQQQLALSATGPGAAVSAGHRDASIPPVTTTLQVTAEAPSAMDGVAPATRITQAEILSAAGTYGDFVRYLQVLPGVVWKSDLTNDLLVRGGHPTENLFVVDGIEIPNINHFSLSGSNGGFTSMIESTTVGSMDMSTGVYDASYASRLSSLIEIHTRRLEEGRQAGDVTVGISGAGGLYQRALARNGSLLVAAHRSVLNLVTNDIGINGVPTYTNGLARLELNPGPNDSVALFTLTGADSIDMTPCQSAGATSEFQTQYSGWRTTEALAWRHTFTPQWVANLTASISFTRQNIGQQQQTGDVYVNGVCEPVSVTTAYTEDSRNGLSMLNYTVRADLRGWLVSAGASGRLATPEVSVTQPNGQLSPYSTDPSRSDADSFSRSFATGQTAAFAEAEGSLGTRWRLLAGFRAETFALTGSTALNPRISAVYRLTSRQSLHGSWNQSSQLPPMMDMLSYPGNRALRPIAVRQAVVGMRLWQGNWGTLDAEAYSKDYRREPVSTEYPALMLSNMIDTLGQGFTWLPLTSAGTAQARGLELTLRAHWRNRAQMLVTAARSQTTYRALDGVRRPGNYDVPMLVNAMGYLRLPFGMQLDLRESAAAGRPYTPFDRVDSNAQMRGIYDLGRINALRGGLYNRLDVELERRFRVGKGVVEVHAGAENVFNRGNLLGYVWLPNCIQDAACLTAGEPIEKIDQMGRYPIVSVRYQF